MQKPFTAGVNAQFGTYLENRSFRSANLSKLSCQILALPCKQTRGGDNRNMKLPAPFPCLSLSAGWSSGCFIMPQIVKGEGEPRKGQGGDKYCGRKTRGQKTTNISFCVWTSRWIEPGMFIVSSSSWDIGRGIKKGREGGSWRLGYMCTL